MKRMFIDLIDNGLNLVGIPIYIELNKKSINESNSILKGALPYRYILLLMGLFSLFCGLVYNDFMAIPLYIFQSCYFNERQLYA